VKGRLALGLLLSAALLLATAPAALAALTVTKAELNGGQLRVEGQGATPNATITIDGVAMGTAGSDGRFRIERSGFTSTTCKITVSDGTSSAQATLSGCSPAISPPPASPPPPPPASTTASFQGLGQLPGGIASYGFGVSGDGKVVVGQAYTSAGIERAFRWTTATGMQDLGDLGGGGAVAYDANADGSVVVGRSSDAEGNYFHGFRWTAAGGMEGLPIGEATDVSADGNAAVGFALLWTAAEGVTSIGASNWARGISPEGNVVVGDTSASGQRHAMRWTRAGGVQDLGTLSGPQAFADSASSHAAVVVGQAQVVQSPYVFWHAFRWTASGGMQDLKTLGGPQSAAYDVSPDGAVIVGKSLTTSSSASETAFRWTSKKQMENLRRALLDAGVTAVQGWVLMSASSVSADGTVIAGYGLNPARQWEAFRAVLPVPR
jgi:probable HAF family extracellular repeat protein